MKRVPVSGLTPGMVTAEDVYSYDQQLIVPAGVILTSTIINRLEFYSIFSLKIDDSQPQQAEDTIRILKEAGSPDSAIKNSPEFKRFKADYEKHLGNFHITLNDMVDRSTTVNTSGILMNTVKLLYQDGRRLNVFDMLLNMQGYDDSTYTHSINVSLISYVLAGWLGFSEAEQMMAASCGLFHDIGKLTIPSEIILKPARLTSEEFEVVKTHTLKGYEILNDYSLNKHILNATLLHHEKCDGSGYPYGLMGQDIDKFSKIVTIADIFDAMTSDRCYRKAMCPFDVIESFEKDGLQKYETRYILTFLENITNSYLNHKVKLSNGMEGDVIFINKSNLARPMIKSEGGFIDLSQQSGIKIDEIY